MTFLLGLLVWGSGHPILALLIWICLTEQKGN